MEKTNDERKWIIYMYTFPNGKRYIGKTCKTLKERQGSTEFVKYKKCPVLWKAIQKYGVANIQQKVLFENYMPDKYASRLEMLCIALFKTNCNRYKNPQYGYNVTDGGEGLAGYPQSEAAREKNRIAHIGKKASEETKKRMSQSQKARRRNCDGNPTHKKGHSEETKEKIRKKQLQHLVSDASKRKMSEAQQKMKHKPTKPVYCVELNIVFPNATKASNDTNIWYQGILRCCKGIADSACGYHWRYATEEEIKQYKIINKLEAS